MDPVASDTQRRGAPAFADTPHTPLERTAPCPKAAATLQWLRHAPGLDRGTLVLRDSRNGRFQTVQLLITATSVEQLQTIHVDLRATGRVHMVL